MRDHPHRGADTLTRDTGHNLGQARKSLRASDTFFGEECALRFADASELSRTNLVSENAAKLPLTRLAQAVHTLDGTIRDVMSGPYQFRRAGKNSAIERAHS